MELNAVEADYRREVEKLHRLLKDRIILIPAKAGRGVEIAVQGRLAAIIGMATGRPVMQECKFGMERVKGIEPSYSAWKAAALPLSYTRKHKHACGFCAGGCVVVWHRVCDARADCHRDLGSVNMFSAN